MLLSSIDDDDGPNEIPVLDEPTYKLTNGVVLELHQIMNKHPKCTFYDLTKWLATLVGLETLPSVKAVRQSIIRLSSKLVKLKKGPNSKIKDGLVKVFLDEAYSLPKSLKVCTYTTSSSSSCSSQSYSARDMEREALKHVNLQLCKELAELEMKLDLSDKKLLKLKHSLYAKHRNTTKKVRRRDREIIQRKKEALEEKRCILQLQKKLADKELQVNRLKHSIDRLRHRQIYWKAKHDTLKESSEDEVINVIVEKEKIETKLSNEVVQLQEENLMLKDKVDEIVQTCTNEEIVTFQGGKYTDDVRSCCYELLSLNVGVRNIKQVITTVLKNISHKSADRLPGKTTLCDMMIECLTVAQAQLGEELTSENSDFFYFAN